MDKAKYIVSLIGTNPLPAFLTILKNYDVDSKVFLIYTSNSKNNIGTENVAKNLELVLKEKIKDIDINLTECDKSDIKVIDSTIEQLYSHISTDLKSKLILDYSSGTKAMSVIFCNRFLKKNLEGLEVVISYLDDESEDVIEDGKSVFSRSRYLVRSILEDVDIDIQDVTRIHGYFFVRMPCIEECVTRGSKKLKYTISNKKIILKRKLNIENKENEKGIKIYVDSLALLNGRLIIYYESQYKNEQKDKYKKELFKVKDIAEKLGGSRSIIAYKCDCNPKTVEGLKKDIRRAYEYEMEKRLRIIGVEESFTDYINKIKEFH